MHKNASKNELKKRVNSFRFAFQGIFFLFKSQVNAWIHAFFVLLVLWGGFFFEISKIEWGLCILSMAFVLLAEAFNTALEQLTDLVSPDFHPLAGKAKDVAAGAVLLAAIGAFCIGVLVFWQPFWAWVFSLLE